MDLEERLGKMEADLLDFNRPVWQVWHFENYTDEDGRLRSVSLLRIHHAMGDGFTMMRAFLQGCQPNKPPVGTARRPRDRRPQAKSGCLKFMVKPFMVLHYFLRAVRKLLFMRPDKPSFFKASAVISPTAPKHTSYHEVTGASVEDLKAAAGAISEATINDVLLVALNGALQRFAQQKARDQRELPGEINTTMWVSLNPMNHVYKDFSEVPLKWGNAKLAACYLSLPIVSSHGRPFNAALHDMHQITTDPGLMVEAMVGTTILKVLGCLPAAVLSPVWVTLANKVSMSMSNVPGPQFSFEFLGTPVRALVFFVPPTGTVSCFFTLITLNGKVIVGMGADPSCLTHEELSLITGPLFEAEVARLKEETKGQP